MIQSKLSVVVLALFLPTLFWGCSESSEIPKLVPLSAFEVMEVEQTTAGLEAFNPQVDILIVMDGSGSMGTHQKNLEANIDLFIAELMNISDLDYRIGVTVSGYRRDRTKHPMPDDPGNSGLLHTAPSDTKNPPPYYITRQTPDGMDVLRQRLLVGTSHDHDETFFKPVLDAIAYASSHPDNLGFFRPTAYLAVIFITDTEDQSEEYGQRIEPTDFYDQLVRFKNSPQRVLAYSVHIPAFLTSPPPTCARDTGGVNNGVPQRIEEFLRLADGQMMNLCSPDFGEDLAQLGRDLAEQVSGWLNLNEIPHIPSIRVYVGSTLLPQDSRVGWAYDPERNAIYLGPEIPHSADPKENQVRVFYNPANQLRE